MSKDPIGFNGADTNLYRYAFNNPISLIDPTGKAAANIVGGILGATLAAIQGDSKMGIATSAVLGFATAGLSIPIQIAIGIIEPGTIGPSEKTPKKESRTGSEVQAPKPSFEDLMLPKLSSLPINPNEPAIKPCLLGAA